MIINWKLFSNNFLCFVPLFQSNPQYYLNQLKYRLSYNAIYQIVECHKNPVIKVVKSCEIVFLGRITENT